jgi:hypothetical protein
VLGDFKRYKIKHKIVDVSEKIDLYGNKVTLEGAFAIDFSSNGRINVPITPLVAADDKFFYGSDEIKSNLKYLSANYPDTT